MRNKLFIIGAGANKQIKDYPTGKELFVEIDKHYQDLINKLNYNSDLKTTIDKVVSRFDYSNSNHLNDLNNHLSAIHADQTIYHRKLKIESLLYFLIKIENPNSIDYFIQNLERFFLPQYKIFGIECKEIQELAEEIVAEILKGIRKKVKADDKYRKQDNYFYKILQNLESELESTSVSIINFNYDTNLEDIFEYFIGIRNKDHNPKHCAKLNELGQTIKDSHIYGDIDNGIKFIRKIDQNKIDNYLQKFIKADDVYFLGFGFDKMNIANLGLNQVRDAVIKSTAMMRNLSDGNKFNNMNGKRIYITNYAGDYADSRSSQQRRFPPKITATIEEIFVVDETTGSSDSNFFLKGQSKKFNFVNPLNVRCDGVFKIFISGLSVKKAIEEDFLM